MQIRTRLLPPTKKIKLTHQLHKLITWSNVTSSRICEGKSAKGRLRWLFLWIWQFIVRWWCCNCCIAKFVARYEGVQHIFDSNFQISEMGLNGYIFLRKAVLLYVERTIFLNSIIINIYFSLPWRKLKLTSSRWPVISSMRPLWRFHLATMAGATAEPCEPSPYWNQCVKAQRLSVYGIGGRGYYLRKKIRHVSCWMFRDPSLRADQPLSFNGERDTCCMNFSFSIILTSSVGPLRIYSARSVLYSFLNKAFNMTCKY